MGGNYQPVGQAHLLTRLLDDGLDPQAALDAPRLMPYPGDLEVEAGVGRRRGWAGPARPPRGRYLFPLGGGQAIVVDRRRGVLIGGSDPRKDGFALGY